MTSTSVRVAHRLDRHPATIWTLAWNRSGTQLVTASGGLGEDDFSLRVWDARTGRLEQRLVEHRNEVASILFGAGDAWLASAGGLWLGCDDWRACDTEVRIWDTRDWAVRHRLPDHDDTVQCLAAAPDGSWLASAGYDAIVRVWDPVAGALRAVLECEGTVTRLICGSGGRSLAAVTDLADSTAVHWWDSRTWEALHVVASPPSPLRVAAASPDGDVLVLADWTHDAAAPGSGIWLVLADGTYRQLPTDNHTGPWFSVLVDPDGGWVAASGEDRLVRRWRLDSGELTHTYPGSTERVRRLRASPAGDWIAAGTDEGAVITWDLDTAELRGRVSMGFGGVSAMEVDPTGRYIAAGTHTGDCAIIDTAPP